MRAKTTAQWRREVPAYDKAIRAVEAVSAAWPGQAPRLIAHIHPDTRIVSIIMDGSGKDCDTADSRLVHRGYARGWVWDTTYARAVWRKVVTS
jgi:hypothetical protein